MLDQIVTDTRKRVEELRNGERTLVDRAQDASAAPSLSDALGGADFSVIAEVKRRSPSRGSLKADLDPVAQASRYAHGGAAAISVLTEPFHFDGSDADLVAVRQEVDIPVLRKDFTLDPLQVLEARAIGASAILLIVAILDDVTLHTLHTVAGDVGLDVLVEVHSQIEARRALALDPQIVGVNNRNLETFDVDLGTAQELAPMLSDVPIIVAESGIHTASDARRMQDAGFGAVLVGESLVVSDDPASQIRELRGER